MTTVDTLSDKLLAREAPLAALEVRAGTTGYDAAIGRPRGRLELLAVFAAPGDDDSRYDVRSIESWVADDPRAAAEVLLLVRALADRLGAPLHPGSDEPPRVGAPGWVALQGPPPERAWRVRFRTLVWAADGSEQHASGELTVHADRGSRAVHVASRDVVRGLVAPFQCTIDVVDTGRQGSCQYTAAYPDAAPTRDTLRSWGAEGRAPSAMLQDLAAQTPALSPRERMVALAAAFGVELTELASVHLHGAGRLSDEALDASLAPVLARTRLQWTLPLVLRRAQAAGESVTAVLHAFHPQVGVIRLMMGVRDAFDLGLPAAKMLVDTACDPGRAEEVAVMLDAVVEAKRAARSIDEWRVMVDALGSRPAAPR